MAGERATNVISASGISSHSFAIIEALENSKNVPNNPMKAKTIKATLNILFAPR